jgi:hypothetical protein
MMGQAPGNVSTLFCSMSLFRSWGDSFTEQLDGDSFTE